MELIEKTYQSEEVEAKWYSRWLESNCFKAKNGNQPTYSIFMPPPNVTGILHMGHTLNNTLQDVLARWARIQGKEVLWIPGTDHAGIATQNKVEKVLQKEGLHREKLGRETFVKKICEWRDKHGHIILSQLKRLGVSCDWSRCVHTLDEAYSKAVLTAFVKLYHRGYIYRGKRLVNWCPESLTALSDEEVTMKSIQGHLYTFLYPVVGLEHTFLPISTTRPETIMGDTAVAVHPNDPRYQHLIGKKCRCPFADRAIPIIADTLVEIEFGTGALKITPAHDPIDFEIGKKHGLPFIDILNPDGTLNENAQPFNGMDRMDARMAVVEALKAKGLFQKMEVYEHTVGYSERADVPIEPRLSEQWFVRYPKVEEAKTLVEKGLIDFWPKRWTKTYLHWLSNIRDWCISRQLWWGHRIPVWYNKETPSKLHVSVEGPKDPENWNQDPDVLDTWFSSWVWPMGTFDWPNTKAMEQKHFSRFFPSDTLVTGPDILFFWVTRMIIASLEFLDEKPLEARIPFRNIYLTGIIRDAQGRKMSKSLGNSPDPIDLIKTYGADGLRIGLLSIAPQGQDIRFDESYLVQGRNFCTKLWNACRFRQMQGNLFSYSTLDSFFERLKDIPLGIYDQHMLQRLKLAMEAFEAFLEKFEFNQAVKFIQQFFKSEFCDWYLEALKFTRTGENSLCVQDIFLRQVLLMVAPFAPFIAEELWHHLKLGGGFIQSAEWGKEKVSTWIKIHCKESATNLENIETLRSIVSLLRGFKAEWGLITHKSIPLLAHIHEDSKPSFECHQRLLCQLVGIQKIEQLQQPLKEERPALVTPWGTFYLELEKNLDASTECKRIETELKSLKTHIRSAETKLNNQNFMQNAPTPVVDGVRQLLAENQRKKAELERLLMQFTRGKNNPASDS